MCRRTMPVSAANAGLTAALLSVVAFTPAQVAAHEAGPDQAIQLAQGAALSATAPAGHAVEWSVKSRPSCSAVTFAGPAQTAHYTYPEAVTTAFFSRTGTYVLTFTDQTDGVSDDVQVEVSANHAADGTVRTDLTVRIMPLGDSITDGTPGWRFPLQDLLTAGGYAFDFVGGRHLDHDGTHDPDHEGHSGWETVNYPQSMEFAWAGDDGGGYFIDIAGHQADVVLLMLGTNDMWRGYDPVARADRLAQNIDDIFAKAPLCRIVVAKIPRLKENPDKPDTDERVQQYNACVPGIVEDRVAAGRKISWVDMYSPLSQGVDFSDGVHFNVSGNAKAAQVWYQGIVAVTENATPTAPGVTTVAPTSATVGQAYTYDVNGSGSPAPTYSLTSAPAGMTVDATSGIIAWTPPAEGSFDVTVTAANGVTPDAVQAFTLLVSAAGVPQIIGHWPLDESEGTLVADSSGNGNDGAIAAVGARGGYAWQPSGGHAGGALEFQYWDDPSSNATEGYRVAVSHSSVMDFTDGVTVSFWAKAARWGGTGYYWPQLVGKAGQFRVESHEYDSLRFYVTPDGQNETHVASNHPSTGEWHHLAATYDGGELRLYIDGALASSRQQTGAIASGTGDIIMGAQIAGEAKCYDGMLDDVRIYVRALTDSDVTALFAEVAGDPPVTAQLAVVTQPADAQVEEGDAVTFMVAASGTGVLQYQWYEDSTPVPGAAEATYAIPAASLLQDGHTYYCDVSDDTGNVTSASATLTVSVSPAGDAAIPPRPGPFSTMSCATGGTPNCLLPLLAIALLVSKRR